MHSTNQPRDCMGDRHERSHKFPYAALQKIFPCNFRAQPLSGTSGLKVMICGIFTGIRGRRGGGGRLFCEQVKTSPAGLLDTGNAHPGGPKSTDDFTQALLTRLRGGTGRGYPQTRPWETSGSTSISPAVVSGRSTPEPSGRRADPVPVQG
jgi:hypothetical protein